MTKRHSDDDEEETGTKRLCTPALQLSLSIKTVYGDVLPASAKCARGYVEISVVDAPQPPKMTYIVVLDKSSSMLEGQRHSNTVQGLRVLNALLTKDEEIIVIPFNHHVGKTYGPHKAPLPPAMLDAIIRDIEPMGGTKIDKALEAAYALAALAEGGVTILLLTDGCDSALKNAVRLPLFHTMETDERAFLCLVGICHDADAGLLGSLAVRGQGTYTVTADADIAGLIGSMVALVSERVHGRFSLSLPSDQKSKSIQLSRAKPTRVPFVAPTGQLACVLRNGDETWKASKVLTTVEEETAADLECITMAFEDLAATHKEALAGLAQWNTDVTDKALEDLAALKLEFASSMPLALADAMEAELRQTRTDIETAMRNAVVARELSHRVASNASTVRNSGMSIGAGSHETPTQTAMRSLSAAMSF
jgi:hypothetical protein